MRSGEKVYGDTTEYSPLLFLQLIINQMKKLLILLILVGCKPVPKDDTIHMEVNDTNHVIVLIRGKDTIAIYPTVTPMTPP